ncbi:hypothetical protein ACC756_38025, partial [Rhizobium ruizarguesonis]
YTIGEPIYENEFIVYPAQDNRMDHAVFIVTPDVALKLDKARFERFWTSINEAKSLTALVLVFQDHDAVEDAGISLPRQEELVGDHAHG